MGHEQEDFERYAEANHRLRAVIHERTGKLEKRDADIRRLREALAWALEMIDVYDEELVESGARRNAIYSDTHVAGKAKARDVLDETASDTESPR